MTLRETLTAAADAYVTQHGVEPQFLRVHPDERAAVPPERVLTLDAHVLTLVSDPAVAVGHMQLDGPGGPVSLALPPPD